MTVRYPAPPNAHRTETWPVRNDDGNDLWLGGCSCGDLDVAFDTETAAGLAIRDHLAKYGIREDGAA